MKQPYFSYDRAELLASPKIPLVILSDSEAAFTDMAREMADTIEWNNAAGKRTVFILPVGPVGQYPIFVELVNSRRISLKNAWFINMDEYLTEEKQWIDMSDPLSFRGFMAENVYGKIDADLLMPENQRIFPDPKDPGAVSRLIEALGGVDICFGGIGINGHVAFNEADDALTPDEFRALPTRVLPVSPATRAINSLGTMNGAMDAMPEYCITVGFDEIFRAKKVRLACFRDWHRAVVRQACHGEESGHFPVTLLQSHPDARITISEFVAALD
ncbi:MAG: glucosamine-6-phosphate isomerase [Oscillospiraceae bacterium]|nr:glucosamine-6-phosphate isomerase [Oscillospiraceae bacterium]